MVLDDNLREWTQLRCILMYRYRQPNWKQWTVGFQGLLSQRGQILGLFDDTACITKVIQRYIQLEDDTGEKKSSRDFD